ncbi:MAG: electron transfer flavoprotein subunit beta/FixA family protein [Desulfobacterota bacterium]|nr:electron transfer flavoprotein subunit beta/FixA family protein [Thermodesulfobacteriota bacterium]MDW8001975.1 electron transfer flavoprotein subunit beta/FixA family protein [Deltaproteobacteria bacterium]
MKIAVCVKQVPDTEAEIKWDTEKGVLKRDAIDPITNPFDEFAIEEALLTREKYDCEIYAISMGPERAQEVLRNALALGVNGVYHINDPQLSGSDTFGTAYALANAIKKIGDVDIVFMGRQSTDGSTGAVPGEIASILGYTPLTYVAKIREIDFKAKRIVVERAIEGGFEVVEGKLPAVVSVIKGINEPRLPNLMGIRKAAKMEIPKWNCDDLGLEKDKIGLAASATRVTEISVPPPKGQGEILKGDLEEIAETLVSKLLDLKIIK